MKVVSQVIETNDYEKFVKLLGNRVVNKLHIKRLKDSFQKNYLLSPIIVNDKFEIIDGQHRFEAAKELGYPINYIMVEGYGLTEVQTLNTNAKNWKKEDYLHAYVDLGYPAYIEFKRFMDEYEDFGIGACEVLLMNKATIGHTNRSDKKLRTVSNKSGTYAVRYFQEGDLEIEDYELACENAEKILMIKPFYDGYNRTVFVRAIIGIFKSENYNHSQFLQRLSSNPNVMQHCNNVTQYKIMVEEIYNFRSREKVSLRF